MARKDGRPRVTPDLSTEFYHHAPTPADIEAARVADQTWDERDAAEAAR